MEDRIVCSKKNGRPFISIDFSYLKTNNDLHQLTRSAETEIEKYPFRSLYALTNFDGLLFDSQTKDIISEFLLHNTQYIKHSAMIGFDSIKKLMFNNIIRSTGRENIRLFHTRDEAMDWLKLK